MPRTGKRVRLARNIFQDGGGIAVIAVSHGQRQEKRFPRGTPLRVLKDWQERTVKRFAKHAPASRGTLKAEYLLYEQQVQHLKSARTVSVECRAWLKALDEKRPRHQVTSALVLKVIGLWMQQGVQPKTINNRMQTLRRWWRRLDGPDAWTPVDDIADLAVTKSPPVVVSADVINRVLANLEEQERAGRLHDRKTRARFMVLASTGKRPCEVMRTQPPDVDLDRRVWIIRDAKGGNTPGGLYLNDEMLAAWELFIYAQAWGEYDTHSFARVLRTAGWPKGVRPYNLRHSTWITASERGVDLADIQAGAGHKNMSTTRRHYVPVLDSRMQRMSETLGGRFGWVPKGGAKGACPAPQNAPNSAQHATDLSSPEIGERAVKH